MLDDLIELALELIFEGNRGICQRQAETVGGFGLRWRASCWFCLQV